MFAWDARPVAAQLKTPLLVLYAEHDGLQPPAQSQLLFDAAQCRKAIRSVGAGHVPNLEAPELVAAILREWYAETLGMGS